MLLQLHSFSYCYIFFQKPLFFHPLLILRSTIPKTDKERVLDVFTSENSPSSDSHRLTTGDHDMISSIEIEWLFFFWFSVVFIEWLIEINLYLLLLSRNTHFEPHKEFLWTSFTWLVHILISYLPTPPLEQDMTQGQFLSGV